MTLANLTRKCPNTSGHLLEIVFKEITPMVTTLMIGPFILFAWVLQYFLNQLIEEDRKSFNRDPSQSDASLT